MAVSTLIADTVTPEQRALMFPTLTPAQIARVARHGHVRALAMAHSRGPPGHPAVPLFIIKAGRLDVVRVSACGEETLVVIHGSGSFSGEANMLLGRPALMRVQVAEAGEAVELTRDEMLSMIQNDTDIGDVIMGGYIHRRLQMISQGIGDVVLLGSMHCASTLRVEEFLTSNGHQYK
jgi:thioredoxin reductase (NADPH)